MGDRPCTWGAGQLFAYSGMEGPTRAASPMVAHTLGDRLGLRFWFQTPLDLWCQAVRDPDPGRRYPRCLPRFEIVSGDAIRLTVTFTDGDGGSMAFASVDQDTVAGRTVRRLAPYWSAGAPAGPLTAGRFVHHAAEGPVVLEVRESADGALRFAMGHDATSEERASGKARRGLEADIDGLVDRRKAWLQSITVPPTLPADYACVYRKAVSIMRVNTCSPEGQMRHAWTTPDRWPHRWMWLHDSAYHAAGHIFHFPELAMDMLRAVFDTQEPDGRIALLMRPDGNFPDITQSPVLAWAVQLVDRAVGGPGFLAEMYPRVRAYLEYFLRFRGFADSGLFRWTHSDESMDNNPRFDAGCDFGAIDLSATLAREFEEAAAMADRLKLESEAARWRQARRRVAEAINRLAWDEACGQYGDVLPDGNRRVLSTCAAFLPLFAGIAPPDRASRLRALLLDPGKFWRAAPAATVAADEPTYYPDMWRGPMWLNMNHLIALGLDRSGFAADAAELRRRTVETVARWYRHTGCIYEFYDADDRIMPFAIDRKSRLAYAGGLSNVSDFHWSAALFVAMCRSLWDGS